VAALVKVWKGVSARRINQLDGTTGALWADEYWDRLIRDEVHLGRVRRYIAGNPAKAKLREGEFTVWSRED
jgi:type I restriction enzyme R subunit